MLMSLTETHLKVKHKAPELPLCIFPLTPPLCDDHSVLHVVCYIEQRATLS